MTPNITISSVSKIQQSKIVLSSGSYKLDEALNGGFYGGRIYEVYGEESTGKTSLALKTMEDAHRMGLNSLYIDAELKLNPSSFVQTGIKTDLPVLQENNQEAILNYLKSPAFYENFNAVAVDTLTSLVSTSDRYALIGSEHYSNHASLISEFLKAFSEICYKYNIVAIFIDQIRFKMAEPIQINQPQKMGYERPQQMRGEVISSACNALQHYSTARIHLFGKNDMYVKKHSDMSNIDVSPIGQETCFEIVKNHQGRPKLKGKFYFLFGMGLCQELELADIAIKTGVLKVKDAVIFHKGEQIASNRLEIVEFFKKHDDVRKKIIDNASDFYSVAV